MQQKEKKQYRECTTDKRATNGRVVNTKGS